MSVPTVSIRYGPRSLPLRLPADAHVDVVGRRAATRFGDAVMAEALASPCDAPSLSEFLRGAQSPLVVVNDATRSTPTARMLALLLPSLSQTGHWRVIVATGLHRAPSPEEERILFGDLLPVVRGRYLVHHGYDDATHGPVDGDKQVTVNRAVLEADRWILLTSVEPHFFAGYTGGRKAIIPGLAGAKTVERSHAGAVSSAAAPLRVDDNPVRQYIHERTRFFEHRKIWAFQVVLDRDDRVAAAFAGDVDATFTQACRAADDFYVVAIGQPYDIVISAVHPPLDLNLYQTMKGWELSQAGVRDGGVLIVTAPCPEGIGASFYTRLIEAYPDPTRWLGLEDRPYTIGLHKLVRTARARARFSLCAVTDIAPDEVARYGYEPFSSVDQALPWALERVGPRPRVLVVEDAALTTIKRA
ncbi:MAG: nickel-dependent lactate racemase [Candidatus Zixiibacteriota bacterium]